MRRAPAWWTLRRHPELRYRRLESDIARLAELQLKILEGAHGMVGAPGGLLIYSVCSPEAEEGSGRSSLRSCAGIRNSSGEPPEHASDNGWPMVDGCLRTLPGPEGMDGFFASPVEARALRGLRLGVTPRPSKGIQHRLRGAVQVLPLAGPEAQ